LKIKDPWIAWCLDEATYLWGTYVDSELESIEVGKKDLKEERRKSELKRKREERLEELLGPRKEATQQEDVDEVHWDDVPKDQPLPPMKSATPMGRFRDPAGVVVRNK
jgi:hypothetical protein